MPQKLRALVPLTCSLALLASCAEPKRIVTNLAPPPDRLVCEAAPDRPVIPPEYQIDWTRISTVGVARVEHEKYVASIRAREGIVAGYLIGVEGRLFICSNNAAWLRQWVKETAAP